MEVKLGYININDIQAGRSLDFLNNDKNLLALDFLTIADSRLTTETSNEYLSQCLSNWKIMGRFDSKDNMRHMGMLILKSKESKNNILCIRPFNTFGPHQSEKAIIPEIIIKCLQNNEIKTTKGLQTREFNYIQNIIDGILILNSKVKHQVEPINLGSNKPIKIKDLVKKIKKFTSSKSKVKMGSLKYRPNEIWRMQANNKEAKLKGWKPKIDFDEGLKFTIKWYKNFNKFYLNNRKF